MSDMRHAMAEQDAAILDYLDGLLRESDVVNANVANLTLISSAGAAPTPALDDDPSDWSLAEAEIEAGQMEATVDPVVSEEASELAYDGDISHEEVTVDEEIVVETALDTDAPAEPEAVSPAVTAEVQEPTTTEEAVAAEMPAESVETAEPAAAMPMDETGMPESDPAEDAVQATQAGGATAVDAHYLTLRVGSIKLAFARDEIAAIMRDAEIEPLRGAPEQVAGSVMHDGKRRMVLSLAPVVIGHAAVPQMQTVVMLGGGLWGVAGGEVVEDMVVNIDQVKWRSPMERHDVRPWLAGLSRADGVAIVDTAALRRALSGTS